MRRFLCGFSSLLLLGVLLAQQALAAVSLSATRVVFNHGATTASLGLVNGADYPVMVQAWIDDGDPLGTPQTARSPFVVLPPIFRMAPLEQRSLRLLTSAQNLPQDRESLFWLNVYEIPPNLPTATREKMLLAFRTQIKVLWRPRGIGKLNVNVGNQLRWGVRGNTIVVKNPTPWHISLSEIKMADYYAEGIVLKPLSERAVFTIPNSGSGEITIDFAILNDEGNQWGYTSRIN